MHKRKLSCQCFRPAIAAGAATAGAVEGEAAKRQLEGGSAPAAAHSSGCLSLTPRRHQAARR